MAEVADRAELAGLGLVARDRLELADKIQRGVAYSRVRAFLKATGLPEARLAGAAGIPARTWERRKKEARFGPEESDRIARVVRLFDLARRVLGDPAAARRWMEEPNLALGERAPLDAARSELGAREVEDVLLAIEHGVYL